jgi:hypothetical protein
MKPASDHSVRDEYITKLVVTGGFFAIFAAFVIWKANAGESLDAFLVSPSDLALLAFATLRLGRLIAYDLVLEPLRQPFTRTVKDVTGAGDTVIPRGKGVQRALGQLISCPTCAGTWGGALLVYGLYAWPGPTRLMVTILGVVGIAELLNALIESLSWSGLLSRARSGSIFKKSRPSKSAPPPELPDK